MRRLSRRHVRRQRGRRARCSPRSSTCATRTDGAGRHQAGRSGSCMFCTMGTKPSLWTPTGISGESITTWSAMTQAAGGGEGERRAGRGDAERQPEQRPRRLGQPDRPGLRLLRPGGHQDLRRPVRGQEAGAPGGINRPIGSLLLGANTSDNAGISQFYGGANGGNLPTIGSPLSAFNTVFGGMLPTGTTALVAARPPQEHPRRHQGRGDDAQGLARQQREGEAGLPPRVHPAAGKQAEGDGDAVRRHHVHEAVRARRRQQPAVHGRPGRLRGERRPPEHHRQRLRLRHHPRGVPAVRQRPDR